MDLSVNYLGIKLDNPLIAASSPLTMTLEHIEKLHDHGIAAVVLKSVFEEQVMGEAAFLEGYSDYPEAADYLNNYVERGYLDGHLKLIADTKSKLGIPVIASINCRTGGAWTDYARSVEQAGADALEVNIFLLPTDINEKGADIEAKYLDIIGSITSKINIPVSVKLGMRFTNVLDVCRGIYFRDARGVVMFNRFFEPDIDIDNMRLTGSDSLSEHSELRNILRTVALCSPQLKNLDISVTSGVHKPEDVVKCILAGAKTTQLCTAIYNSGLEVIGEMKRFLSEWMESRGFDSVERFRGLMSRKASTENELFERVQYMKFRPGV